MGKFIIVVFSVIYLLVVSGIGSLPVLFWGLTLSNYLSTVAILTVVQLFISGLWRYHVDAKTRIEESKVDAVNAKTDATKFLNVECAYCKEINSIDIMLGNSNKFKCSICNQLNNVMISVSISRTTGPITFKKEAAEIFENID